MNTTSPVALPYHPKLIFEITGNEIPKTNSHDQHRILERTTREILAGLNEAETQNLTEQIARRLWPVGDFPEEYDELRYHLLSEQSAGKGLK